MHTIDELEAARRKLRAMNVPGYAASGVCASAGRLMLHVRESKHLSSAPRSIDGVEVVTSVIGDK